MQQGRDVNGRSARAGMDLPLRIDDTHIHLGGTAIASADLTALTWWSMPADDRERRVLELHADPGGTVRFTADRDVVVALSDQLGSDVAPYLVRRLLARLDGGDVLRFPDAEGAPHLTKEGLSRKGMLHRTTEPWTEQLPAALSGNRVYFKERGSRGVARRLASIPVEDPIGAVLPFLVDDLQARDSGTALDG